MLLTESQLRELVAGRCIDDNWPTADIEAYLHDAVSALQATGLLDVDAEFNHYGSGYASYVHVFCEKRDARSRTYEGDTVTVDGLAVYLSRLSSFAVYGNEKRALYPSGSSMGYLTASDAYTLRRGEWKEEVAAVRRVLEDFGFVLPAREDLSAQLPIKLEIPTILGDSQVFDAIFYWED